MQLQWMLLEDAVASGDSTATHLLSFLASARGSPVVALARLTKGVGAKDWRNISPGVAEMLMRDVSEAVEVYEPCGRLIARTTPSYLPSCGNGRRAPWSICSTPSTLRERGS